MHENNEGKIHLDMVSRPSGCVTSPHFSGILELPLSELQENEITLPETNIALENEWLEDDPFLLGFGLFSGANC